MGIENYGVWVCQPTRYTAEARNTPDPSPHIALYFTDGSGNSDLSAAINVKSTDKSDSELACWFDRTWTNSAITDDLQNLAQGFEAASSNSRGSLSLDYIRQNLVNFSQAKILPYSEPQPNDILDDLEPILTDAINAKATAYIFGSSYNTGIHDIHMNQGSGGDFENATHSDGALIFHYPSDGHWEAVFIAFASQSIPTNDQTGQPEAGSKTIAQLSGQGTSQSNGSA